MTTSKKLKQIATSFDNVTEEPHFEKISYRIKTCTERSRSKKIFATYDEKTNLVCVMLSPIDQASFCSFDKKIIYPVPNKWGQKGATYITLNLVREETLTDALTTAYQTVSQKKMIRF